MRGFRFFVVLTVSAAFAFAANAQVVHYATALSGPAESPPNNSPGTGLTLLEIDTVTHLWRHRADFSGLLANTSAAHVHASTAVPGAGTAGVATQVPSFPGFPLGVTAGSFDNTFDMTLASSFNPSYMAANGGTPASARTALFTAISTGRAYFNVHSSMFPGGEIRGFYALVPEPASFGLLAVGALMLVGRRR